MAKKELGIDFDRTVHDLDHPIEGRVMGPPMVDVAKALAYFQSEGYKVTIFSENWRTGDHHISDFMAYWKIPYDDITNEKRNYFRVIDDQVLEKYRQFNSWSNPGQYLL